MRFAGPGCEIKSEGDDVVGDEAADRAEAVDAGHEAAHDEETGESRRQDAEIALEGLVGGRDIAVGKEDREGTARESADETRDLAAPQGIPALDTKDIHKIVDLVSVGKAVLSESIGAGNGSAAKGQTSFLYYTILSPKKKDLF